MSDGKKSDGGAGTGGTRRGAGITTQLPGVGGNGRGRGPSPRDDDRRPGEPDRPGRAGHPAATAKPSAGANAAASASAATEPRANPTAFSSAASANRTTDSSTTFGIIDTPPAKKAGRPPSAKKDKEAQAQIELDAKTLATSIVAFANGIATAQVGEYASMTTDEMQTIRDPLERILKRLPPEAASLVQRVSDPFLVVAGSLAWGARIMMIRSAIAQQAKAQQAVNTGRIVQEPSTEPPPPGSNGAIPTRPTVHGDVTPIPPEIATSLRGGNGAG